MKITYSSEFPRILAELKCTLAMSTYQSGMVILISSMNGKNIIQFAKRLKRPMGIAISDDGRMAVACKDTVEVFGNHRLLAINYPEEPKKYDGMFFPRATYYSGQADIHDLAWQGPTLIGTNTAFSCLSRITDRASFEPFWQPSFIDELLPEDRCHLNGLAMVEGKPKYVSLFGKTNQRQGWRQHKLENGLILDIENEAVLAENLPMPHSPRFIQNKLYYLLSAIGEIHVYDFEEKKSSFFGEVDGFVRGMNAYENYLIVSISTIRESSQSFKNLPVTDKAKYAGLIIFEIDSGKKIAEFYYLEKVKEIFEIAFIPDITHGVILDKSGKTGTRAIAMDKETYFWKKESEKE